MKVRQFRQRLLRGAATGSALCVATWASASYAQTYNFDLPPQPMANSLRVYAQISGQPIIFTNQVVDNLQAPAVRGAFTPDDALKLILRGSHLIAERSPSGAMMIERPEEHQSVHLAQAAPRKPAAAPVAQQTGVETIVVTAQRKQENIQSVPIAVTALSQEQLTSRQIAAGPDLIRDVPNMNFGKTNFSGYSIELRGIGTQAISVSTDPAVAVAMNGIPFIRNHFFEQEFFDVDNVEVLRGPQGTLWGRNATAGVVNMISAKPSDQFDMVGSVDIGNYNNRRFEGMINIPIVGDKLDLRLAGEWTKRDGYSTNEITNSPIDGRDLWSGRLSIGFKPTEDFSATLVWEHFSENDDRLRSGKQLCKTAPIPDSVNGVPTGGGGSGSFNPGDYLSQGCLPASLYSKDSFEVPNGFSLPYYAGLSSDDPYIRGGFDPYSNVTQSTNLRDIQTSIHPLYKAKNDIVEFNADYKITPGLTLSTQTGYNNDFLWSTEDYNRFETAPGAFNCDRLGIARGVCSPDPKAGTNGIPSNSGVFCDPQLGCQDRLVAQDLNNEHAWQASQEVRLASNFSGPLNFSAGGNYLHYETVENYYVFINTLTQFAANNMAANYGIPYQAGVTDESACLPSFRYPNNNIAYIVNGSCAYIDPNSLNNVNGEGHNYFLSQNPYVLDSYALFGEVYYNLTNDLRLTGGLRWTDDRKHFREIPSELLIAYYGYPSAGSVDQEWQRLTGRAVVNWTPKLDFTDQTLIYSSYAHGYKAGGANPPGAIYPTAYGAGINQLINPIHPLTFKPEYIDAFELGTKNELLDNTLTLNGDVFYYNYHGYQISRIVDRTAINDNFNAHVVGAELESAWEPLPGLRFNFAGGWEESALAGGTRSVDLMDRSAGTAGWMVVRPYVTNSSNCVLPDYVVAALLQYQNGGNIPDACSNAYIGHVDPVTQLTYTANPVTTVNGNAPPTGYPGFDPVSSTAVNNGAGPAPNNGQGFDKNLSGNQLPNAPPFTLSFGAQYTLPVSSDWAATLRGDFYFQADSWARVFNDNPYDRLHGYTNLNLALILASDDGWQVMGYVKNVFNTTAITGDFLNSDDSGLTTNVFLTDPRLYGVRVTKDFSADAPGNYGVPDFFTGLFSDADHGKPPLWIELGGGLDRVLSPQQAYSPPFMSAFTIPAQKHALDVQSPPNYSLDWDAKVSFEPEGSDWVFSGAIRYGHSNANRHHHQQTKNAVVPWKFQNPFTGQQKYGTFYPTRHVKFADGQSQQSEKHLIVDFKAGKDLGIGLFGESASSVLSGGMRFVRLNSRSHVNLRGEPDVHYTPAAPITSLAGDAAFKYQNPPIVLHDYAGSLDVSRSFNGIGPSASWDVSTPVAGNSANGELDVDLGLNAAVLFGRQKTHGHHQTTSKTYSLVRWEQGHFNNNTGHQKTLGGYTTSDGAYLGPAHTTSTPKDFNRSREVTVPNLGGFVGASYRYRNAKISFGYRADFFFGAMDGDIDSYKSETRGFYGPFATVSIGLGG